MSRRPTHLAAVGDVNDVAVWSGTPYHLLQAARAKGVIDRGLALEPIERGRQLRRYAWNLASVLRGRGKGGYQFSEACLARLWQPQQATLAGARMLNCFQLTPRTVLDDPRIESWFYIDQTMPHYLEGYGLAADISAATRRDILRREHAGYARAAGIVCHSRWAADCVVAEACVAPEKVHVVVPGANLDPDDYAAWAAQHRPRPRGDGPLRLVFVGKAPLRKGLDRLIRALRLARRAGADCRLRVIGCGPEALPAELREAEGVEWRGFIHKRRDARSYLDAVADCDVGCLLSRAEAGGMCLREFHALGLAVIAPDVGGSPDHALRGASRLVKPEASDAEIAALLQHLATDRDELAALRAHSWAARESVLWPAAVAQLARILDLAP